MRRFAKNRWWAFILTLSVLIASNATFSSLTYGDGEDPVSISDGSGGGASPPMGDPDGPSGPTKWAPTGGRLSPGGNGYAVTPVGDGGTAVRVWSWRFHVVLRSLMSRWLRF
ncbi:MAG: hypothetical protein AAB290_05145 [Candidatus Eisenbacteria bacterium]